MSFNSSVQRCSAANRFSLHGLIPVVPRLSLFFFKDIRIWTSWGSIKTQILIKNNNQDQLIHLTIRSGCSFIMSGWKQQLLSLHWISFKLLKFYSFYLNQLWYDFPCVAAEWKSSPSKFTEANMTCLTGFLQARSRQGTLNCFKCKWDLDMGS